MKNAKNPTQLHGKYSSYCIYGSHKLTKFFLQKIYFVQKILQNFYAMKIGAIR